MCRNQPRPTFDYQFNLLIFTSNIKETNSCKTQFYELNFSLGLEIENDEAKHIGFVDILTYILCFYVLYI